ncbi:M20 family metallopeptidase [Herbaspirillum sp. YR522]|uniref:M20 family metallopeptidase n=1 Tax=Herbaspirillum sp. YR522 TaxID=1144342 RepID=UPI00026FBC66|nr:M20 family metallopeptidase [Herbaspirillum sp. YR522]EJN02714.1 acetylornithine deacetylase/succinyldiaminopimelate desuccinylase-like deacylase [Herbaspirillum sp. YR522]
MSQNSSSLSPQPVLQAQVILQEQLPAMLVLLEELVNIDSGSYDIEGVSRVSARLSGLLADMGFAIEQLPVPERADLVVATHRMGGRGRLVILGHCDTVWPAGTVADWPYARLDEARATGPGVGDMKGGLVMALFALRTLIAGGFDALESIRFILVPDEELGSTHSRALIEQQARDADVVLVLEPGRPGGGVISARGALGAFFMKAHGCSAHCASNYAKGASALRELAGKVVELDGLSDPDNGAIVNVGVLQGGTARQVVPGEARMDIDLRARTDAQAAALRASIERIAADRRDDRVAVELTGRLTRPAFTSERNRTLVALAKSVADELSLAIFEAPPAGGGSDGNFTAAQGIPTLDGLGPVCHDICSRQEIIELQSLVDRGALFCGLIQQLPSLLSQGN